MAAKGTKVTQREKKRMWELYQDLGSYTKVAKKMRRSPDTVSRYVQEYERCLQVAQSILNSKQKKPLTSFYFWLGVISLPVKTNIMVYALSY